MNDEDIKVPQSLWQDIVSIFAKLTAPCRTCAHGGSSACWQSSCAAFQFRPVAIRVSMADKGVLNLPNWVRIESELLFAVRQFNRPVRPSEIRLDSTNSRVIKSQTISRLVRQGRLIETRTGRFSRLISLPKKGTRKNEQPKPTGVGRTVGRIPSR